eukprot:GHVU01232484.1.p2 GENE.GHVU01232484.1~~GHVU01232484.1.p2  ORF type:complete len:115 (+),score=9.02 GHVU01232484.1:791-1135(+)
MQQPVSDKGTPSSQSISTTTCLTNRCAMSSVPQGTSRPLLQFPDWVRFAWDVRHDFELRLKDKNVLQGAIVTGSVDGLAPSLSLVLLSYPLYSPGETVPSVSEYAKEELEGQSV